jgi:hypothetical protein
MTEIKREYSYDEMIKLRNDIHKIKNKDNLKEIKNIIIQYNPNHSITKNENGMYLCFHNLVPETYYQLNLFIKKLAKKANKVDTEELTSTQDIKNIGLSIDDTYELGTKLKYSNKEKTLLKRKVYDNELKNQNNSDSEELDNSIFIKSNKKN